MSVHRLTATHPAAADVLAAVLIGGEMLDPTPLERLAEKVTEVAIYLGSAESYRTVPVLTAVAAYVARLERQLAEAAPMIGRLVAQIEELQSRQCRNCAHWKQDRIGRELGTCLEGVSTDGADATDSQLADAARAEQIEAREQAEAEAERRFNELLRHELLRQAEAERYSPAWLHGYCVHAGDCLKELREEVERLTDALRLSEQEADRWQRLALLMAVQRADALDQVARVAAERGR